MAAARPFLRQVLLLQRDVPRAAAFYGDGLGLDVIAVTRKYAELDAGGGARIALKHVDSEAQCTVGYSPFLNFAVPDVTAAVARLVSMGAVMDGAIKYQASGKLAALRGPDGHMIALFEPNGPLPGEDG
ncbi:unnamed protein product [Pedinophyceae sp. YPF-701]|nr:unnamed protein product [Pedinophyceae sp. YPF-701]